MGEEINRHSPIFLLSDPPDNFNCDWTQQMEEAPLGEITRWHEQHHGFDSLMEADFLSPSDESCLLGPMATFVASASNDGNVSVPANQDGVRPHLLALDATSPVRYEVGNSSAECGRNESGLGKSKTRVKNHSFSSFVDQNCNQSTSKGLNHHEGESNPGYLYLNDIDDQIDKISENSPSLILAEVQRLVNSVHQIQQEISSVVSRQVVLIRGMNNREDQMECYKNLFKHAVMKVYSERIPSALEKVKSILIDLQTDRTLRELDQFVSKQSESNVILEDQSRVNQCDGNLDDLNRKVIDGTTSNQFKRKHCDSDQSRNINPDRSQCDVNQCDYNLSLSNRNDGSDRNQDPSRISFNQSLSYQRDMENTITIPIDDFDGLSEQKRVEQVDLYNSHIEGNKTHAVECDANASDLIPSYQYQSQQSSDNYSSITDGFYDRIDRLQPSTSSVVHGESFINRTLGSRYDHHLPTHNQGFLRRFSSNRTVYCKSDSSQEITDRMDDDQGMCTRSIKLTSTNQSTIETVPVSTNIPTSGDTINDGRYYLELKSKRRMVADPRDVFNQATSGLKIHVDGVMVFGQDLKVTFVSCRDRTLVLEALREFSYRGHPVKEMYEIRLDARSDHVFVTSPFSNNVFNSLAFRVKGGIDATQAATLIVDRNADWFDSIEDIINVKICVPQEAGFGYVITIFVSARANEKILRTLSKGMKLDLGRMIILPIHEPSRVELCFKCHDPGHRAVSCPSIRRCKYCLESHDSRSCAKKNTPLCYRCRLFNLSLPPNEQQFKVKESHPASSATCPSARELRKRVIESLKEGPPSKRFAREKFNNESRT